MPWLRSGNYYQIQEVLAVIEESDVNITDRCDLVVVPPDPDVQTDTKDIDENNLEDLDNPLQDVAGRIQLHTDNNEDVTNEGHWSEDVGDLQLNLNMAVKSIHDSDLQRLTAFEPIDIFREFFDDSLLTLISSESNRYPRQNNRHSFQLDNAFLQCFL
jgi:hypothetical protein